MAGPRLPADDRADAVHPEDLPAAFGIPAWFHDLTPEDLSYWSRVAIVSMACKPYSRLAVESWRPGLENVIRLASYVLQLFSDEDDSDEATAVRQMARSILLNLKPEFAGEGSLS